MSRFNGPNGCTGLVETAKVPIRNAATTIILRDDSVLMGQRGKSAVFMPGKFVFPGGAVDANDALAPVHGLSPTVSDALSDQSDVPPSAIVAAAIRELWEETGQILGTAADWNDPPQGWRGFAATGHVPNGSACTFVFRAVTPEGRPRRFDARFILAEASLLASDPDDFSQAEDELSHLQWVPLKDARNFDLPFITEVVLAEVMAARKRGGTFGPPPFYHKDEERDLITRLGGRSPLDQDQ